MALAAWALSLIQWDDMGASVLGALGQHWTSLAPVRDAMRVNCA
jgi:hypothetical protein